MDRGLLATELRRSSCYEREIKGIRTELTAERAHADRLAEALRLAVPHLESIVDHNERVNNGAVSHADRFDLKASTEALTAHEARRKGEFK